jgi:hypothetical protein
MISDTTWDFELHQHAIDDLRSTVERLTHELKVAQARIAKLEGQAWFATYAECSER